MRSGADPRDPWADSKGDLMTKDMDKLSVAREALTYRTMGSGGRCNFTQLREAVSEACSGSRTHATPFDPKFYPGHQMVQGLNYNSLDRIVTAFVDAALAQPAPDAFCKKERDQLREVVATYIDRAKIATIREDLQQAVDGAIEWANAKGIRPRGEATMEALAALTPAPQPAEGAMTDDVSFIWKWIERAIYDPRISAGDALSVIAHHPCAPWKNGRWDVDHKPYADQFYKHFPQAAAIRGGAE